MSKQAPAPAEGIPDASAAVSAPVVAATTSPSVIEEGIPFPEAGKRGTAGKLRALVEAKVGDSIKLDDTEIQNARAAAYQVAGPGWASFATEGTGTRVWKKAEPTKVRGNSRVPVFPSAGATDK